MLLPFTLEDSPDFMIDFATLTGAARVALGTELPALFCNDDQTASAITQAAATARSVMATALFDDYERHGCWLCCFIKYWPIWLWRSITAALFLRRFAGKSSNWAHIDVMAWDLASRTGRPKAVRQWTRALYGFIRSFKNPNSHAANQRGFQVQAQP